MRVLIVDDEPIARQILREELAEIPGVELVGEAASGLEALPLIRDLKPDLLFLDLQMPGMGGFDLILSLTGPHIPTIVIVTAYDQHAIRAFEAGAIDYLLKPVSQSRLHRCLDRVRLQRGKSQSPSARLAALQSLAPPPTSARPRKIIGQIGAEYHLLECSQVLAFQAERELVWIVTRKQRYLANQTLRTLEEKLSGLHFARIHRNALVNLDHVVKMAPLSSHRWLLTLANQQEFTVSKRQARAVQELLQW